ncbi:RNA-guided endonuclease IscB [Chamaesiphon polymorphus]|uniref:HNH endonuclease n=1 Tax=Chamaesiphon polymorphus CCALA 037 TaxID=2107692 RepID=A0A2T1GCP3_9CYAN|nr:RNA-guided endonuclease IscB [Chamaesiphon polymorphus]PSB55197.1 HNH endonuclease [Chamaesiphon polymorphus CCALA 037]
MSNYVFLIDANKQPMNPIHPAHARKLMELGKAAVFRMYPFTLIMNRIVDKIITYPLSLRIDPGSKLTGISIVNNRDEVIWAMELQHRGWVIKDALETRKAARRGRRNRHTRYRQARFLNRKRSKGWLAPSLMHRVLTIETWVKRLIKFSPVAEIRQELVRFDTQAIQNPEISGTEYQQGTLAGYEVREYLLEKWGRKCTYCSKECVPLQIEHIQARANGGTDRVSNLCLACEKCNQKKGTKDLKDFLKGKPDLVSRILKQAKAPLKDAAAVNSTRWKLFETLKVLGLPVTTGTGGQTKYNRTRLRLPKEHWLDAACVGVTESLKVLTSKILKVKATGYGTRRLCRMDKFGFPCSKPRQSYKTSWKTGDIARTIDRIIGRVVVQNEKRLEVRVNGKRHYCKPDEVKPIHRKDGYSYA